MTRTLGIDLGTTNSCAALLEHDAPLVVPLPEGKFTMPSVVAFVEDQRLVGFNAKRQFLSNPEQTIFAVKRLIGRSFADPQTQQAIQKVSYRCVEGPNGDVWIDISGRTYAIPEISALVLAEIKRSAEEHFHEEITQAVITVPAYFNDRQRHATKQAGQIAGLDVLRVVNEPTAAALAYGFHQGVERQVAVYDLGGGTFDVSVLRVGGGAVEVLASAGDAFLGGHDFDNCIFDWLCQQIERDHAADLRFDLKALQRLREAAEAAKIRLSDETETTIALPFLTTDRLGESVHHECALTRTQLESLVGDLVERTSTKFNETIAAAGLSPSDIDEVLMVGGMTLMPAIRDRVAQVVSSPAASGVHPDLAVAVGAAVQAALVTEDEHATVLLDVTPHNLGIKTVANLAETVIPKNTKVPANVTKRFSTIRDNQETVRIVVFQGDERRIDQNEILGEFHLEGLQPALAGERHVDVCFNISADGIVHVTATDVETGAAQEIRITDAVGLSEQEMERMIAEHQTGGFQSTT